MFNTRVKVPSFPASMITDCSLLGPETDASPVRVHAYDFIPEGAVYTILSFGQTGPVSPIIEQTGNSFTLTMISLRLALRHWAEIPSVTQ